MAKALTKLTELGLTVTLEGAHLSLDANERVPQGGQDGGGLGVVADGGLKVAHPLTQQVSLGGQSRGTPGEEDAGQTGRRC